MTTKERIKELIKGSPDAKDLLAVVHKTSTSSEMRGQAKELLQESGVKDDQMEELRARGDSAMFSKQKKEGRWTEPPDGVGKKSKKIDYGHLPWFLGSKLKPSDVRNGAFVAHGRRWGRVIEMKGKGEAKLIWLDDKSVSGWIKSKELEPVWEEVATKLAVLNKKRPSGSAVAPEDFASIYIHCYELTDVNWAERMRLAAR